MQRRGPRSGFLLVQLSCTDVDPDCLAGGVAGVTCSMGSVDRVAFW